MGGWVWGALARLSLTMDQGCRLELARGEISSIIFPVSPALSCQVAAAVIAQA